MKKNCHNCKHGYIDSDCDSDGYNVIEFMVCKKRSNDEKHYDKLNDPVYLDRAKRCCELHVVEVK